MYDRPETDEVSDDIEQQPLFLAFQVGRESYLISVHSIAEVIRIPKIVPVPDVPEYLVGVVNLRGRVVPIVDLARRFGLPPPPENARPVIIVVESGGEPVGLLVECVHRVVTVPEDRLDHRSLSEPGASVIEGVAIADAGDFLVLDVDRLVAECRQHEVAA